MQSSRLQLSRYPNPFSYLFLSLLMLETRAEIHGPDITKLMLRTFHAAPTILRAEITTHFSLSQLYNFTKFSDRRTPYTIIIPNAKTPFYALSLPRLVSSPDIRTLNRTQHRNQSNLINFLLYPTSIAIFLSISMITSISLSPLLSCLLLLLATGKH
ncbi:hypothetical protein BKA64DRAFT_272665 [Cadophora sp. MPI-SDFR-AT-0126]|nr:hypothetical protein BKA64DRAFT_272665 [Leotiomycetes sp. MPI-SDFR-AT-0126]